MSADIRLVRWADHDRDEFERLTTALARVRDAVRRDGSDLVSADIPQGPEEPSDLDRARVVLAQAIARDTAAGDYADLFANPAWRMMLTLYVGAQDGSAVSAEAIKANCGAQPLAAARWLKLLEQRGLMRLQGDVVSLTPAGDRFIVACLRAI